MRTDADRLELGACSSAPVKGAPRLVGVLTLAFVWVGQGPPGFFTDFDYLWIAGHAVWRGLDSCAVTRAVIEHGAPRP
jgi:hypothetical protein